MKKNWPKIIYFIVVLFLYFLPSIVIKVDHEFYESLKGPHLPAAIFIIAWSVPMHENGYLLSVHFAWVSVQRFV